MSGDAGDDSSCMSRVGFGLLLGIYSMNDGKHLTSVLTPTAEKYDKRTCGRLLQLLQLAGPCPKLGEVRIFYDLEPEFSAVAVVGLGLQCEGYCDTEQLDKGKENIRVAAASAARALAELEINRLYCESFGHAESCAEGAALAVWIYQEYKNRKNRKNPVYLELFDDPDTTGWQIGLHKAAAQNLAKGLTEAPPNEMTPILFAQRAVEILCKAGVNVQVKVRNWAELQGMGGFLAVSKGSCQEPIFLEISYQGCGCCMEQPIVLVGKGCTFDSGGLCLRNVEDLHHARGDMAGAACIVAAIKAIASLQLPLNIRGLIPLCEHMPGCSAMKPGDIVETYNKKFVMIQNTQHEGRLMLADALAYANAFCPCFTLDVASLCRESKDCMSTSASLIYTNSDRLWNTIQLASVHTGDRVWRMPLFSHYWKKVAISSSVDMKNVGRIHPGGEPCRGAAFLREFAPPGDWMHMDNYNVILSDGLTDTPYIRAGMTGRPTRTLIEFLSQLICKHDS
ncbi:hypothetical protein RUM44_013926 [Polyplax serrata]|uniref:Cytosol aminopeptidase n=1 Tax=Polyplax serrata TaxID=468196 RepID=A0ABR1BK81_POLSC